jgi:hypothetical protein
MASAELSRRVEKVVGCQPLCEMGVDQRREFQEALLDADRFEDLHGKWQATVVAALGWSTTRSLPRRTGPSARPSGRAA